MKDYKFDIIDRKLKFNAAWNKAKGCYDLPAGTEHVDIATGQSSKVYKDFHTGMLKNENVYRKDGILYNE